MAAPELKSAFQWLEDPRVQKAPGKTLVVEDADGWFHDDGVSMNTLITLKEFHERLAQSTISFLDA